MPEHVNATDPEIHEPKGISTAAAQKVYVSDGAGSGNWSARENELSIVISDISTATVVYVPIPYAGLVAKVVSVLGGAITGADATIDVKNSSGVSMGTITVANASSAAGDVDVLTPSSNNNVSANSFITIATDGASTNTVPIWFTIVLTRA